MNLEVTQKINLIIDTTEPQRKLISPFIDFIKKPISAEKIIFDKVSEFEELFTGGLTVATDVSFTVLPLKANI